MCSNLRLSKSKNIVAGNMAVYRVHTPGDTRIGSKFGVWGFNKGIIYNIRSESAHDKFRDMHPNRGYIEVVGFVEKGVEFKLEKDQVMYMAVIYNTRNEFALLTEDSQGPVALVHHRMPVILGNDVLVREKWLNEGKILHMDPYLLISNKTA